MALVKLLCEIVCGYAQSLKQTPWNTLRRWHVSLRARQEGFWSEILCRPHPEVRKSNHSRTMQSSSLHSIFNYVLHLLLPSMLLPARERLEVIFSFGGKRKRNSLLPFALISKNLAFVELNNLSWVWRILW